MTTIVYFVHNKAEAIEPILQSKVIIELRYEKLRFGSRMGCEDRHWLFQLSQGDLEFFAMLFYVLIFGFVVCVAFRLSRVCSSLNLLFLVYSTMFVCLSQIWPFERAHNDYCIQVLNDVDHEVRLLRLAPPLFPRIAYLEWRDPAGYQSRAIGRVRALLVVLQYFNVIACYFNVVA